MSYWVNRYAINLESEGDDLVAEVESGLDYARTDGYEEGLAEARAEYENRLNEHDAPFNQLVDILTRVHDTEHSDRWPLRQCDRAECRLVTRYLALAI